MEQTDQLRELAVLWATTYGVQVIVALLILLVGRWISRRLANVFERVLEKRKVDPLVTRFLGSISYFALLTAVVLAAISHVGISIASFLAVLGTAALAVGLALKDNLSNFSSGVLLVLLRPFRVGDYVSVAGTAGTVREITIFNTHLITPDNQLILVPNSKIMGDVITNVTANDTRRLDLIVGISYADDTVRAKEVARKVLAAEDRLLAEPEPIIAVAELADSSVNLVVRPWVKTSEYWDVRFTLIEKIKHAFDEEGISIPFPQRDVHLFTQRETGTTVS